MLVSRCWVAPGRSCPFDGEPLRLGLLRFCRTKDKTVLGRTVPRGVIRRVVSRLIRTRFPQISAGLRQFIDALLREPVGIWTAACAAAQRVCFAIRSRLRLLLVLVNGNIRAAEMGLNKDGIAPIATTPARINCHVLVHLFWAISVRL